MDEAVQDASQADGWQLLKLADLFVQYGQDSAVERMMYEKVQQERYTMYADWLKNHHLAKNNLAAALEVERLITERGRANYQVACTYLVKIRSLYEKLDETEQWTTYLAWLRKRHSRLSTLKQELAAAGL